MSPEPSELIAAFESKVPFFRGLGSGVFYFIQRGPGIDFLDEGYVSVN